MPISVTKAPAGQAEPCVRGWVVTGSNNNYNLFPPLSELFQAKRKGKEKKEKKKEKKKRLGRRQQPSGELKQAQLPARNGEVTGSTGAAERMDEAGGGGWGSGVGGGEEEASEGGEGDW